MRDSSTRGRQAVLEAAFDVGIRHFDVARSYGLGAAEAQVGRFARGRRDQLILATKFGIDPGVAARLSPFQGPARRLIARLPALRRVVKHRALAREASPRRYDAVEAKTSLETSLRELGTDHVDILFLHAPSGRDDVRIDDVCEFLEDARQRGLLRAWGVSGAPDPSIALIRRFPVPTVLQVRDDPWLRSASRLSAAPDVTPVTFGVIGGVLEAVSAYLRGTPDSAARWSNAVGRDCSDARVIASLALRSALRANPHGAVLVGSTRPEHICAAAADAAAAEDAAALDAFAAMTAAEVACPDGG